MAKLYIKTDKTVKRNKKLQYRIIRDAYRFLAFLAISEAFIIYLLLRTHG